MALDGVTMNAVEMAATKYNIG